MASRSMGRNASSVGMMEGAFFVSRTELLTWVNGLLQTNLQKVEQCASGAVYCAILDACHPQQVSMQKINWMAKVDHEFLPNYKVLQSAFDRLDIQRHVAVDQLIRAKYQDNLEFLQWMKCYWEREGQAGVAGDYDPVERRAAKMTPPWARAPGLGGEKENLRPPWSAAEQKRPQSGAAARSAEQRRPASASAATARPASGAAAGRPRAVTAPAPTPGLAARPQSGRAVPGARQAPRPAADLNSLKSRVREQEEELEEVQDTIGGLEKERDYYFKRLRDVEILCTTLQAQMAPGLTANKLVQDVLDILHTVDDDEQDELAGPPAEGGVGDVAGQGLGECF